MHVLADVYRVIKLTSVQHMELLIQTETENGTKAETILLAKCILH